MQSFSKGAGSRGTGIYFHVVAAAQSALNKLCMQHGHFQESLPGQSLAFHLHLMGTFLTFHLAKPLAWGGAFSRAEQVGRMSPAVVGTQDASVPGVLEALGCQVAQSCLRAALHWWTHFSCTAALSSLSTTTVHQVTNLMSLPEGLLCQKHKGDLPELGLQTIY